MDESLLPKELRSNKEEASVPKVDKVISGKATVKKPSIGKKIIQLFMPEDIGSLKEFIWNDLVAPAILDGFFNTVNGITSMICYGKFAPYNGNRRNQSSQRSNSTYRFDGEPYPYDRDRGGNRRRDPVPRSRSNVLEEVSVTNPSDAYAVLDTLVACLEEYGRVPVSTYYDAFGVSRDGTWTDERWGWTSLAEAKVIPCRGGAWTVYLPNPQPI